VQELCNRYNYNIQEAYVVDGSTRSSHSNAYFLSVLWKKKLVIYDTLLKNSEGEVTEERDVMAVVAHELSHWRYNHVNKLMVLFFAMMLVFSSHCSSLQPGHSDCSHVLSVSTVVSLHVQCGVVSRVRLRQRDAGRCRNAPLLKTHRAARFFH
jgi:Zn-dependent protease with chaperone function